jgi:hypothetical protein
MSDFTRLRDALWRSYNQNLQRYDVAWPGERALPALVKLFEAMPNPVSQEELTAAYHDWDMPFEYNKQARHLADSGWAIATGNKRGSRMVIKDHFKKNELALLTIDTPNPEWIIKAKLARHGALAATSWNDLLKLYSDRGCTVCGRRMRHYDKGHLDPLLPPRLDNIVPMCSDCNNWAATHSVGFKLDSNKIARPVIACIQVKAAE